MNSDSANCLQIQVYQLVRYSLLTLLLSQVHAETLNEVLLTLPATLDVFPRSAIRKDRH